MAIQATNNEATERAILGAVLLEGAIPQEVSSLLQPCHFQVASHREIFAAELELARDSTPIDTFTLADRLASKGRLHSVGGVAYLSCLTDGTPRRGSYIHLAKAILDDFARRSIVRVAEAIAARATDRQNSVDDLISYATSKMQRVAAFRDEITDGPQWRSLFHTLDEFENARPLQFAIDNFLQESGITLIGGLAGHGKTLIMLSMAKALLNQSPLFGWDLFSVPRASTRVLYLIPESAIGPFWARVKLFRLEDHVRNDRLLVRTLSATDEISLDDARLLRAAEGADIFLDTAVRFMTGAENEVESAKAFAAILFKLLSVGARTIVGCHHAPKGFGSSDRMTLESVLRGSGDLGAMLCTAWGIRQIEPDSNRVYVQNVKPRDFQPCAPFVLEGRPHIDRTGDFLMLEPPGTAQDMAEYVGRKGGAPVTPGKGDKVRQAAEMKAAGMSLRGIADNLGVSKSCVEKWLREGSEGVH